MPKKIVVPASADLWDEERGEFITRDKEQTIVIEHSLISISKWEQKWKKPFVSDREMTPEEFIDYVRCMTLNNVDDRVYDFLPGDCIKEISDYIADPMTATTFSDNTPRGPKEVITSEIIYYSMISFGIPVEFEKWHFNRLMALIRVFSIKEGGQKKMSRAEAAAYQRSINESRIKGKKHRR